MTFFELFIPYDFIHEIENMIIYIYIGNSRLEGRGVLGDTSIFFISSAAQFRRAIKCLSKIIFGFRHYRDKQKKKKKKLDLMIREKFLSLFKLLQVDVSIPIYYIKVGLRVNDHFSEINKRYKI